MSESVRAFLSIDINNESLLSRISEIQGKLDTKVAKMKLVEIKNIHFTLRFFGDTSHSRIEEIKDCLQDININSFEIQIEGVGAFPKRHRPRVIWVGVGDNAKRVEDLKREIDRRLETLGYPPERRKFTPHATIARVRYVKNTNKLIANIDDLEREKIGAMTISYISMKKSTLTPSGPIYETLWQIS